MCSIEELCGVHFTEIIKMIRECAAFNVNQVAGASDDERKIYSGVMMETAGRLGTTYNYTL